MINSNKKLLISVAAVVFVLLFITIVSIGSRSETPTNSEEGPGPTTFSSPLTKSEDELVIGYGGSAEPNMDAVVTQYRIFGIDKLPLSKDVRTQLPQLLTQNLREYIQPTLEYTYIHIVSDTIKQSSDTEYSFDFYIDSPESYFHLTHHEGAGANIGNPITQIPWEGIK